MRKVRPTPLPRLVALVAVLLALALGAQRACSGSDTPEAAPESAVETTTTTAAAEVESTTIATATVPDLVVFAEAPSELRSAESTTTTTAAPNARAAIPRVGLNSAGVAKVPLGYQFDNPTYFDNPLVMQVLEDHGDWLKVLIQARPNQTEGWVKRTDVELSSTTYRMVLSLEDHRLVVYDGDDAVVETDVVIGKSTTPTPVGRVLPQREDRAEERRPVPTGPGSSRPTATAKRSTCSTTACRWWPSTAPTNPTSSAPRRRTAASA